MLTSHDIAAKYNVSTRTARRWIAKKDPRARRLDCPPCPRDRPQRTPQELLIERLAQAQAQAASAAPSPAVSKKPTAREPVCRQPSAEFAGFGARLQDLYERAQTDLPPWRGGLSREKREALRILLREDRELDGKNPLEL